MCFGFSAVDLQQSHRYYIFVKKSALMMNTIFRKYVCLAALKLSMDSPCLLTSLRQLVL